MTKRFGATHLAKQDSYRGTWFSFVKAFTLAEVLITLGIIGVVAAMTLPTVVANINERTNSERQANIAYKITQAMEQMRAHGELDGSYKSTDEFVDVLQKYLKIAKRCDANNIASCWPTEKITTADGEEFEVKDAKTGKNLGLNDNTSNNVGLVLGDGASLILTYDTSSKGIDVGDRVTASKQSLPVGNKKYKDFAYTTSVTNSIDFVMDVNGSKGPNSETINNKFNDIRGFRLAKFAKGCAGIEIGGTCVVQLTSYDPVDTCDGTNEFDTEYTRELVAEINWINNRNHDCSKNYWAGAKAACAKIGMKLPNLDLAREIYKSQAPDNFFWLNSQDSEDLGDVYNFDNDDYDQDSKDSGTKKVYCVGN